MKEHPQAEILRAIADGKVIEVKERDEIEGWEEVSTPWNFISHEDYELRIKPATININGYEVREPVREPLEDEHEYWLPAFSEEDLAVRRRWVDSKLEQRLLERGLIHLTKEAASLHAKALLSFTRGKL